MAQAAARALSAWSGRARRLAALAAAGALLLVLVAPFAAGEAQTLYKYRSPAGNWVYSDRLPPELAAAASSAGASRVEPAADETHGEIRLRQGRNDAGDAVLVAVNELPAWVQIAYRVEAARNLDPAARMAGNELLPPMSETELMALPPIDLARSAEVSFSYQYIYGHPAARHEPRELYRLPYELASAHRVSQAWPDTVTHEGTANRHAIDFEMPVGTGIHAAREGIVVEVTSAFADAGQDLERDVSRANLVRILHDDGTLALYGHLAQDSIRVEPGQRVERGAHIADSGNTGYSSGPHLHFVVQRNRGGELESVSVSFAGAGGSRLTLATGDRPVAY